MIKLDSFFQKLRADGMGFTLSQEQAVLAYLQPVLEPCPTCSEPMGMHSSVQLEGGFPVMICPPRNTRAEKAERQFAEAMAALRQVEDEFGWQLRACPLAQSVLSTFEKSQAEETRP